ncbi:PREDICTED: putative disease resistance protein RGA3 [Nelumbo nucifera]|uniref:Disease resistance RPP13-like protein 1 n=2 Tax=Nelumbo nucifera TaxID=4432 RepID=A0A822YSL6_NELNU|nr:PREDICTED: putative disease resistance protein RGA3 [Nelumbo nucifera]DAD32218.1 TPA_asm: hypothetical protein HUJ06_011069 [Nelumbo nucifera]
MAQDSSVLSQVEGMLAKLASPQLKSFGSVWKVEKELGTLSETLKRIQGTLSLVERAPRQDRLVKTYLVNLREAASRADATLEEFIKERERSNMKKPVREFLFFSLTEEELLRRNQIGPFIDKINNSLVEIDKSLEPHRSMGNDHRSSRQIERRLRTAPVKSTRLPSSSAVDESCVFGRRKDANSIIEYLVSDHYNRREIPVISIIGEEGIGKTTLAQLVYNDPAVEKHFDIRAWVCVSGDFSVERLTRTILECATTKPCRLSNLDPVQRELQNILRGKNFLLVLDDVCNCNRNGWDALRATFSVADAGSRIVVTTQNQSITSIMSPIFTHPLTDLEEEDCWFLLKKRAFGDDDGEINPRLERIGLEIVKKSNKLPSTLTALGNYLYAKEDESIWEMILDSDIDNFGEEQFNF